MQVIFSPPPGLFRRPKSGGQPQSQTTAAVAALTTPCLALANNPPNFFRESLSKKHMTPSPICLLAIRCGADLNSRHVRATVAFLSRHDPSARTCGGGTGGRERSTCGLLFEASRFCFRVSARAFNEAATTTTGTPYAVLKASARPQPTAGRLWPPLTGGATA